MRVPVCRWHHLGLPCSECAKPRARIKVVTLTEDTGEETQWCLAGWQETYNASVGGRVFLTLQNGEVLRRDIVMSSMEFYQYYSLWPTFEFICAEQVEEVVGSLNNFNQEGRRF